MLNRVMKYLKGIAVLVVAVIIALIWLETGATHSTDRGRADGLNVTSEQEEAIGTRAVQLLTERFHGVSVDPIPGAILDRVGRRFVSRTEIRALPYPFQFHLLNEERIANGFALPEGQIVLTLGLMRQLHSDGEVAAVVGHLIGHVIARDGLSRLARSTILDGVTGTAIMSSFDVGDRSPPADKLIEDLVGMEFDRAEELSADTLGLRLMNDAGYDPRAMVDVMNRLEQGGSGGAAFLKTHPGPDYRIERIRVAIRHIYPDGVPGGLNN